MGSLHMHVHLPERVLHQYGHVQIIQRSPDEATNVVISPEEIDDKWLNYSNYLVDSINRGPQVMHATDCVDGYMQWFYRIPHPFIIPPLEGNPPRVHQTHPVMITQPSTSDPHHAVVSLYNFLKMIFYIHLQLYVDYIFDCIVICRRAM